MRWGPRQVMKAPAELLRAGGPAMRSEYRYKGKPLQGGRPVRSTEGAGLLQQPTHPGLNMPEGPAAPQPHPLHLPPASLFVSG